MKFSLWNNFIWYFKIVVKQKTILFVYMFLGVILNTAALILTAYLPAIIVSSVVDHLPLGQALLKIALVALFLNLAQMGESLIWTIYAAVPKMGIRLDEMGKANAQLVEIPFEKLESVKTRTTLEKGFQNAFFLGNTSGMESYIDQSYVIVKNVLSLIIFLTSLTVFNPWILVVILASGAVTFFVNLHFNQTFIKIREKLMAFYLKMRYLKDNAYKIENGKDMRLYQMTGWYQKLLAQNVDGQINIQKEAGQRNILQRGVEATMNLLQNALGYTLLIIAATAGTLTIAQFTLYFGFMNQFAKLISNLVTASMTLDRANQYNTDLRKWYQEASDSLLPYENRHGKIDPSEKISLTFETVSFKYPQSDTYSVENVSFTIAAGEKIALVGANGAGKSTIVKLIAGLLEPTSGRILINGQDITTMDHDYYLALIAPVFQEALVFALSVGQNISLGETYDVKKVEQALKDSHLDQKIAQLPQGFDTPMTHYLDADGIELSGGEEQKLMLARALYKDAPLLILDEPTAALDALAEKELYEAYNQLAHQKTSIFVSHRLASTRFCDRIFFMEQAQLKEVGTHEALLEKNGAYAKMYHVQSYYYQKEGAENEKTLA